MEFRIADTFTDSLAWLTGDEQKAVKTTAFDLQLNPSHPSLQFHRLEKPKDPNFWSMRVSKDVRIIVHRTRPSSCSVMSDITTIPINGRSGGSSKLIPRLVRPVRGNSRTGRGNRHPSVCGSRASSEPPSFATLTDTELLGYGVPPEWLPDVRKANEESLLEIADHLPKERRRLCSTLRPEYRSLVDWCSAACSYGLLATQPNQKRSILAGVGSSQPNPSNIRTLSDDFV